MENHRAINILWLFLGGALLVFPLFGFAYDDKTTHPALTQEIIKLFNNEFKDLKVSDEDKEIILQGSIDEDSGIRYLQHFYDPVYNRGLVLGDKEELAAIGAAINDPNEYLSSKNWAQNTSAQAGFTNRILAGSLTSFFSGEKDFSWDRAIYEYTWGDKNRGLLALGHTLHLIEDASVPDHTRNDPHPPSLDTSPYESWTKKFTRQNLDLNTKNKPLILSDLNSYFDSLAKYSNNNFFSKDTVESPKYTTPTILKEEVEILSNGIPYRFGYYRDESNKFYHLLKIEREIGKTDRIFSIEDSDNKILYDYWSLLSKQAVLHGAGVVKLFFDEVGKEKQSKILYDKNRPWLGKQLDKIKNAVNNFAGIIFGTPSGSSTLDVPLSTSDVFPPAEEAEPEVRPQTAALIEASLPTGRETSNPPQVGLPAEKPGPQPTPLPSPPKPDTSPNVPTAGGGGPSGSTPPPPEATTPTPPPTISPSPPTPPPPPPDTTPPNINLVISECNQSLSPENCLIEKSAVNIEWSSDASDLNHYSLNCQNAGLPCSNFNISTTTATTTTYMLPEDNKIYEFSAKAVDHAGNESSPAAIKTVERQDHPVVINEIAWGGTSSSRSAHEWIELFNPTTKTVDISQMKLRSLTDQKPNINLSGTIPPKAFYLIQRSISVFSDITASTTASFGSGAGVGLDNSGEVLAIEYKGATIDQTPDLVLCANTWCGGTGSPQNFTMERYDPYSLGNDKNNWGTFNGVFPNGKNVDGIAINGTPGRRNSLNFMISKNGTTLNTNKTLLLRDSPYIIPSTDFTVFAEATLTLEPGVVIKFLGQSSSLRIHGILKTAGTTEKPIIFTSLLDDEYGGDTNNDGTATIPKPGDWRSVKISADGSVFDHAIIRYGGLEDPSGSFWANLRIEDASATIKNSVVEHAKNYGLLMKNSTSTVESNIIRLNNRNDPGMTPGTGVIINGGAPSILKNTFSQNTVGLVMDSSASPKVEENSFTNHAKEAIQSNGAYPTFSGNTANTNGTNGIFLSGVLDRDYELSSNLPYVIHNNYLAPEGKNLTIKAGTILKLAGTGSVLVRGKLDAKGTTDKKIVFTSLNDDEYGGDTNANATSTMPLPNDWLHLTIENGVSTSTVEHAVFRYGGNKPVFSAPLGALHIKNSAVEIKNTTVEKNYFLGISMENTSSVVINDSLIKDHQDPGPETFFGIYLTASSTPTIKNTSFKNNEAHIFTDGTSSFIDGGGNVFE